MEAFNINSMIIQYIVIIFLASILTLVFGRKMPMLKKLMTICALIFIFTMGIPITNLAIQLSAPYFMTQDIAVWIQTNPNTFYVYKHLFALLYSLIFIGIFLQRTDYYEGRLSLLIPSALLMMIGIYCLLNWMIVGDRYSTVTLLNNVELIVLSIVLLVIIFILRSSKVAKAQNPEFGTLLMFIMFLAFVVVLVLAYDRGMLQKQHLYYAQGAFSILVVQAAMLLFMFLSGLLLLRYLVHQNPDFFIFQFNIKCRWMSQLSLKVRLSLLFGSLISAVTVITFLLYVPFEDQVKKVWLDENSNTRRNSQTCLSTPIGLEGDLKWTLSIPKVDPVDQKRTYYREELSHAQKIAQLDALVQVGFLKKIEEDILIEVNQEQRYVPGFRYHIMPKMTAYGSGGRTPCIHYTDQDQQFLGVDKVTDLMKNYDEQDRQILKKFNITDYVEVDFFVGIKEKDLFPWVKIPEVTKAFNLKHQKQQTMKLAKIHGVWVAAEYLRVNDLRHITPAEFKQKWDAEMQHQQYSRLNTLRHTDMRDRDNDLTIYPHQIESGDFPQKSKVLETFKREYQSGNVGNPVWYHLAAAKVPTDVRAEQGRCESYSPYKVGIITDPNMKRNRQDNIILYSLPYLQDMVKRGILYSYEGQITLKDQSYPGIYFEPTKLYDEAFGLCLNLHEPRFEMLKARSYSSSSLHFDTVAYYERPYWASDEMLENFEELRLMLEYGDTNIARNPAYDLPYIVRKTPVRYW